MLGALMASSKALQENVTVAYSRQLMLMSSGDFVLMCLRVLFLIAEGHGKQH